MPGDPLGDAGADQGAGGGAAAVVREAGRHAGRLAGGAPIRPTNVFERAGESRMTPPAS